MGQRPDWTSTIAIDPLEYLPLLIGDKEIIDGLL